MLWAVSLLICDIVHLLDKAVGRAAAVSSYVPLTASDGCVLTGERFRNSDSESWIFIPK